MSKKNFLVVLIVLLFITTNLFSFRIKEENTVSKEAKIIELNKGDSIFAYDIEEVMFLNRLMEREIVIGNLKLSKTQAEEIGNYIHERYDQYYKGVKVWGAQLIRHLRGNRVYCINGRYYPDIEIDTQPSIELESALQIAQSDLSDDYNLFEEPELVVFPEKNQFHLTYKFIFKKHDSEMIYFVDAHTGNIILNYENLKTTAEIGIGRGHHNDLKKMSVDYSGGTYRSRDLMRPARIKTYDMAYNWSVWWSYGYNDSYLGKDSDNDWSDSFRDKSVTDVHAYTGWTYDYYYLVHNRKGMNNHNKRILTFVNFDVYGYNNAFYDPTDDSINFYDGDGVTFLPFCTALDIVAHEFTHGVTHYTSNLIYWDESGALNEAFSDIMSVCVEFYFQSEGSGFLKADWLEGEDAYKTYGSNRAIRRFDKPYLLSWSGGPYPDHYSLKYTGSYDNKGVHINSNIVNHWFYLLAHGGTNRISGINVSGIGLDKAEKIAYRAWVYYLFPSADFHDARTATIQAVKDLYGAGSTEESRVKKAWNAVGV